VISWGELEVIGKENNKGLLGRSSEVSKKYQVLNRRVRAEYATMRDFICSDLFGIECEVYKGKKQAKRCFSKQMVKLLPNEYPYNLAPNIEHLVLWSLGNLTRTQVDNYVRKLIKKNDNGHIPLFIVFCNPVQSIRDVYHAHVFVNHLEEPPLSSAK